LPFYLSSADSGFSSLTHLDVDKKFGTWEDIKHISVKYDIVVDLVVDHISDELFEFKDFLKNGDKSFFSNFFITTEKFSSRFELLKIDKRVRKFFVVLKKTLNLLRRVDFVFHEQGVNKFVLEKIYRPRLGSPFEKFIFADGKKRSVWCTFSKKQIDLDIKNRRVRKMIQKWIENLGSQGVKLLRLDVTGYCSKKRGTTSFMIPEIYKFIRWLAKVAHDNNMLVLPEIHDHYSMQVKLAKTNGINYVYDFCLPALVLYSIYSKNTRSLERWIKIRPENQITTLDTHDGIGLIDVEGLVDTNELEDLFQSIFQNGGNVTMRASGTSSENVDIYQINTTYYSALGEDDKKHLIARAIKCFVPGIPQVYYVGLLAGVNDEGLLEKTGNGRDVNRYYYSMSEIEKEIKRDVVRKLGELMIFRNEYPAFNGCFEAKKCEDYELLLVWKKGRSWCKLFVDFEEKEGSIEYFNLKKHKSNLIRL